MTEIRRSSSRRCAGSLALRMLAGRNPAGRLAQLMFPAVPGPLEADRIVAEVGVRRDPVAEVAA